MDQQAAASSAKRRLLDLTDPEPKRRFTDFDRKLYGLSPPTSPSPAVDRSLEKNQSEEIIAPQLTRPRAWSEPLTASVLGIEGETDASAGGQEDNDHQNTGTSHSDPLRNTLLSSLNNERSANLDDTSLPPTEDDDAISLGPPIPLEPSYDGKNSLVFEFILAKHLRTRTTNVERPHLEWEVRDGRRYMRKPKVITEAWAKDFLAPVDRIGTVPAAPDCFVSEEGQRFTPIKGSYWDRLDRPYYPHPPIFKDPDDAWKSPFLPGHPFPDTYPCPEKITLSHLQLKGLLKQDEQKLQPREDAPEQAQAPAQSINDLGLIRRNMQFLLSEPRPSISGFVHRSNEEFNNLRAQALQSFDDAFELSMLELEHGPRCEYCQTQKPAFNTKPVGRSTTRRRVRSDVSLVDEGMDWHAKFVDYSGGQMQALGLRDIERLMDGLGR